MGCEHGAQQSHLPDGIEYARKMPCEPQVPFSRPHLPCKQCTIIQRHDICKAREWGDTKVATFRRVVTTEIVTLCTACSTPGTLVTPRWVNIDHMSSCHEIQRRGDVPNGLRKSCASRSRALHQNLKECPARRSRRDAPHAGAEEML